MQKCTHAQINQYDEHTRVYAIKQTDIFQCKCIHKTRLPLELSTRHENVVFAFFSILVGACMLDWASERTIERMSLCLCASVCVRLFWLFNDK